jgi:hypothetical protein
MIYSRNIIKTNHRSFALKGLRQIATSLMLLSLVSESALGGAYAVAEKALGHYEREHEIKYIPLDKERIKSFESIGIFLQPEGVQRSLTSRKHNIPGWRLYLLNVYSEFLYSTRLMVDNFTGVKIGNKAYEVIDAAYGDLDRLGPLYTQDHKTPFSYRKKWTYKGHATAIFATPGQRYLPEQTVAQKFCFSTSIRGFFRSHPSLKRMNLKLQSLYVYKKHLFSDLGASDLFDISDPSENQTGRRISFKVKAADKDKFYYGIAMGNYDQNYPIDLPKKGINTQISPMTTENSGKVVLLNSWVNPFDGEGDISRIAQLELEEMQRSFIRDPDDSNFFIRPSVQCLVSNVILFPTLEDLKKVWEEKKGAYDRDINFQKIGSDEPMVFNEISD